jgi:hypothetical protein
MSLLPELSRLAWISGINWANFLFFSFFFFFFFEIGSCYVAHVALKLLGFCDPPAQSPE